MKTALSANYMHQRLPLARPMPVQQPLVHTKQSVLQKLKGLGMSRVGLHMMESRYLYKVLAPDEFVGGVIYGHCPDGNAILVATNKRVIYLDRKPMFTKLEEVSYDVISGVSMTSAGLDNIVTLHTRIKDYAMRSFNQTCANGFVSYIETRSLQGSRWDP